MLVKGAKKSMCARWICAAWPVALLVIGLLFSPSLSAAQTATNSQSSKSVKYYVRFIEKRSPQSAPRYGLLKGNKIWPLKSELFSQPSPTLAAAPIARDAVTLVAPLAPRTILAVGLNYRSHAGMSGAREPNLFFKAANSIIGPGAVIPYPEGARNVHYEGEMVIVIGKRGKNIPLDKAKDYVFGVTAGNDVSERIWQSRDLQWVRAKSSDGFGPIGPVIVSGLNYDDLLLQTRLNGKTVQKERTSGLLHSVAKIISFTSRTITLEPGDIIFTGTPGSTSAMKPGDIVEVELEGVGILRNRVK